MRYSSRSYSRCHQVSLSKFWTSKAVFEASCSDSLESTSIHLIHKGALYRCGCRIDALNDLNSKTWTSGDRGPKLAGQASRTAKTWGLGALAYTSTTASTRSFQPLPLIRSPIFHAYEFEPWTRNGIQTFQTLWCRDMSRMCSSAPQQWHKLRIRPYKEDSKITATSLNIHNQDLLRRSSPSANEAWVRILGEWCIGKL